MNLITYILISNPLSVFFQQSVSHLTLRQRRMLTPFSRSPIKLPWIIHRLWYLLSEKRSCSRQSILAFLLGSTELSVIKKLRENTPFIAERKKHLGSGAILQAEDVSCILYTACFRSSFLHVSRETLDTYFNTTVIKKWWICLHAFISQRSC